METRFWQKDIETMNREKIRSVQEIKFKRMIEYVEGRSGFYRKKFKSHGVSLKNILGLDDLKELPFTDRGEIFENQAEHGQFGTLMCTDFQDPGQTIGLTGDRFSATGKPLRVIISVTDAANQGKLAARGLIGAGISPTDYVYIADHPQFNLVYMHTGLGSINVGSKCLLVGTERTERNIRIYMTLYPPNAFFISPSYAKFMGNLIVQTGKKFHVRTLLGWGEPGYSLPSVRKEIESLWRGISLSEEIKVCDVYAMIEVGLLGFECRHQKGLHGFEDSYIYEIINPETEKVLGPGEEGELVVTHIDREGMPLIRYRTGDITIIDDSPCPCGRTHLRLLGIKGRLTEKLEVKGIPIYWSQVEEIMGQIKSYRGNHNILVNGTRKLDVLEIAVDQESVTAPLLEIVKGDVQKVLKVPVYLKPTPASELFVYPHKSQKIIDQMNLDAHRKELDSQKRVET